MSSTIFTTSQSISSLSYPGQLENPPASAPLPVNSRPSSSAYSESGSPTFGLPIKDRKKSAGPNSMVQMNISSSAQTFIPPTSIAIQDEPTVENDSEHSYAYTTHTDNVGNTIDPRSKHIYSQRFSAVRPPEESTPTPSVFKARAERDDTPSGGVTREDNSYSPADLSDDDTPRISQGPMHAPTGKAGQLRLHLEGLKTRHASESHINTYNDRTREMTTHSSVATQPWTPGKLLRKKSGEPVKSSLKLKRPGAGLCITTVNPSSKSEPSTPTHTKAVHFDAKLEHVKLFLAEQKPLAVSRDGSPTDTSGTDNEFPSFIFGSDEESDKRISIHLPNMPSSPPEVADIALQKLELPQDSRIISGLVRVRNIAFEKWLAVRFTFDLWQTTSEVTARYAKSVEGGTFDIFTFSIRLHDIWSRIEEKRMFLALRYIVAGKEFWDNNSGQNYTVIFSKSKVVPTQAKVDTSRADILDLRSKLEVVAKGREGGSRHRRSPGSQASWTGCYDFASAPKHPWKGGIPPSPPRHQRTSTYPSSSNTIPWPPKRPQSPYAKISPLAAKLLPTGSPLNANKNGARIHDDSDSDDLSYSATNRTQRKRNRTDSVLSNVTDLSSGDEGAGSMPAITVSVSSSPISRNHSFPQPAFRSSRGQSSKLFSLGGSTDSSPSSVASSLPEETSETEKSLAVNDTDTRDDYSLFLNRFCFYTGSDSRLEVPSDIPRSHSASSVEEFLRTQSSPTNTPYNLRRPFVHYSPPTRSSVFDDIRSGSSTPTARSLLAPVSWPTRPIMG